MAKEKQLFHTVEEAKLKELVRHSYLLDEVISYNENGVKEIPAFTLALPILGFDARRWHKPKHVALHVVIGNETKSYFVFLLENKYGEKLKLALPMEDHATNLPVPYMSGELHIAKNEPKYATKGDRKKNIFTIPLSETLKEVYRYGMILFMDKHGILDNPDSQALSQQEPEVEISEAQ